MQVNTSGGDAALRGEALWLFREGGVRRSKVGEFVEFMKEMSFSISQRAGGGTNVILSKKLEDFFLL